MNMTIPRRWQASMCLLLRRIPTRDVGTGFFEGFKIGDSRSNAAKTLLSKLFGFLIVIGGSLVMTFSCIAATQSQTDEQAVVEVMKATWDKLGQPLQVAPVIVSGNYSVASWLQGDKGGRALLMRRGTTWRVIACGGDGMRDAGVLRESGISENAAQDIATRLKTAEARFTEDQRRRFDSFGKTIPMDADHGQHSPVHKRGS
jgi:hypothetical protein